MNSTVPSRRDFLKGAAAAAAAGVVPMSFVRLAFADPAGLGAPEQVFEPDR